ncbi:MAG: DUF1326 domain-containing protein [Gammaproteobacteria bacterium]
MDRREFSLALGAVTAAPAVLAKSADTWQITADVAESCGCEIPCPCNFGRKTKLKCEGSRLVSITDGHVGGESLAGVAMVITFEMGKWTKIYLDENMTAAQRAAFDKVFPVAFAGFKKLMREMEYVPLTVERSEKKLRFSVPASTVEIVMMPGLDGEPIRVNGLPSAFFHDYVQYESVVHKHESADSTFSYSGTNGFTSRLEAAGKLG